MKAFYAVAIVILCTSISVLAQVPDSLAFQGCLLQDGDPVSDGSHTVNFTLYDHPTATSLANVVWTEVQGVTTSDCVCNTYVGRVNPLTDVAFDRRLWLGLAVDGQSEMVPRTALASVPYAFGLRGLRVTKADESYGSGINLIGGSPKNTVGDEIFGATISGGGGSYLGSALYNHVNQHFATVGGGWSNSATGFASVISGGESNDAGDTGATVGGGLANTAGGSKSTVCGGELNEATGESSTVCGGSNNTAGSDATVGGGLDNVASGGASFIGGGGGNVASATASVVAGGEVNEAGGTYASVGGGERNTASGNASTVPGGSNSLAQGRFSFAAGRKARAIHNGVFAWADTTNALFESTGVNQFIVRAGGGVGLGTTSPSEQLEVQGAVKIGMNWNETDGTIRWTGTELQGRKDGSWQSLTDGHSPWVSSGPDIYFSTGRVRMGSSISPLNALSLSGSVDITSNLGIGTTAPLAQIHTTGSNGSSKGIKIESNEGDWASFYFRANKGLVVDNYRNSDSRRLDIHLQPSGGNVGIGTGDAILTEKLEVVGTVKATKFDNTSDRRLKQNIVPIDDALAKVSQLRGVSFEWNDEAHLEQSFQDGTQLGFIAQEVADVLPDVVSEGRDGMLSLSYDQIIPLLVEAMKEQQTEIERLRKRLAAAGI